MIPVFRLRRFHRILAIVVGIQILFWTLSGVYFAWTDIDEIHGDHLRNESSGLQLEGDWVSPSSLDFPGRAAYQPITIRSLDLINILGDPFYRIRVDTGTGDSSTHLIDPRNGQLRPPISEKEAVELARASFRPQAELSEVRRLEEADVGGHHEYRGGPLPAWQVSFKHASGTRVYVAATEGTVTKHRSRSWRVFDFLWMLHTMDYLSRDDINNPALRGASIFGIVVVLSGYLLWFRTRQRARSRT